MYIGTMTTKKTNLQFYFISEIKDWHSDTFKIPLRRRPYAGSGIRKNSVIFGKDYRPSPFCTNTDPFVHNLELLYQLFEHDNRQVLRNKVFKGSQFIPTSNTFRKIQVFEKTKTALFDEEEFYYLCQDIYNSRGCYARNKSEDFLQTLHQEELDFSQELTKIPFDTLEDMMNFTDQKAANNEAIIKLIQSNIELDKKYELEIENLKLQHEHEVKKIIEDNAKLKAEFENILNSFQTIKEYIS